MTRIPWKGIADFLECLEGERTLDGFIGGTMLAIERLIGFDFAINAFTEFDDVRRLKTFLAMRAPERLMREYGRHYGRLDPWLPRHRDVRLQSIDWKKQRGTEFGSWAGGYRLRYTVGVSDLPVSRAEGYVLALHREEGMDFTDREKAILSALSPHLHNLAVAVRTPEVAVLRRLAEEAVAAGLTPREREIAGLVAGRLSSREIGERLFISHHTVEKHIEHIYGKLRAGGRGDLRRRLSGEYLPAPAAPWRQWLSHLQR